MKSTFVTFGYKDGFIHTSFDDDKNEEIVLAHLASGKQHQVKSVHAAKLFITKDIKKRMLLAGDDDYLPLTRRFGGIY